MRDIAASVGIKAASVYNHFKSKEDIFVCIIEGMTIRYEQMVQSIQMPSGDMESVAEQYMRVSGESLGQMAKELFRYFLKDDYASKFRRMLTVEQLKSERASQVYHSFFIDGAIDFQKSLFGSMMKQGSFIDCDPHIMALHFYSPIFLMLNQYDNKPEREQEALDILDKHIKQFLRVYKK